MEVVNKCPFVLQTVVDIQWNKSCCLSGTGTNPIVTCVYLDKKLNRPILIHIPLSYKLWLTSNGTNPVVFRAQGQILL